MNNPSNPLLIAAFSVGALGLPVSAAEMDWDAWFRERTQEYEQALEKPDSEKIPILGQMLRINTGFNSPPLTGVRLANHERAQKKLILIPGHAEYYGKRISDIYQAFKGTALGERKDGDVGKAQREMNWSYQTLSQLPSPETVRVLRDFLSDEWNAPIPSGAEHWLSSLAIHSVTPLSELPFTSPPTPSFPSFRAKENLAAWQQWYAEVKSGQRSFAFRGQPVSYRFKVDGSVETTARNASQDPADPLSESARPAEASRPDSGKNPPSVTPTGVFPWAAGGVALLLAASITFFLRKQR